MIELADVDTRLITRARSGDRQAAAALASLCGSDVYRLALYIFHKEDEARDAAADIFARLYATPEKIPLENFRAWLMRVTYNHCLDNLRRRKTLNRLLPKIYERQARLEQSPEEAVVEAGEQAEVRQAVANLPEQERVIVFLRYYQQLSYTEISSVLGVPEATVGTRLHRAREKLRKRLSDDRGGEGSNDAVCKSI